MAIIDPDKPILNITDLKKVPDRAKLPQGEFGSIFRQALVTTEVKAVTTESAAMVSALRPAQFITAAQPSAITVVERAEQLIDTMEAYRQKLMESGTPLKEIQGLVHRMSSQSESLAEASATVDARGSLGTIANQSLMLSSIEIARFSNGDYNDQ